MPSRRSIILTAVAAFVATAIGVAISYAIHWFPAQASTQASNTDTLYHVLVIASIPIFVIVVTVVLYSAWQFRMRPGEELKDGPPIHGNTRLEVFWTAIPTVLLLGLVGYSFVVLRENEKKPAREIQIGVTAQQFAWSYQYPPSVTGGAPISSDQLYVPEGESVQFNLHSKDVIHAFYVPKFLFKRDVVPGRENNFDFTADVVRVDGIAETKTGREERGNARFVRLEYRLLKRLDSQSNDGKCPGNQSFRSFQI